VAAQAAGTGRTRLKAESQGMGGRTWNMRLMSVTLDMSKLSGWLNAQASENMRLMVVTLEVSKLSGWLNAVATCRGSFEGIRCEARCWSVGGRWRTTVAARSVQGRAPVQIWGRARGGVRLEHVAHICDAGGVESQQMVEGLRVSKHAAHVRDAGGVETQRLVERRRFLPRVESRECGAGVCRRWLDCRLGAEHAEERTLNMLFMDVTLEVSKLSGCLNADADCRQSKRGHKVRGEVYESGGSRRWMTAAQAACRRGLDCRLGAGHAEERT